MPYDTTVQFNLYYQDAIVVFLDISGSRSLQANVEGTPQDSASLHRRPSAINITTTPRMVEIFPCNVSPWQAY